MRVVLVSLHHDAQVTEAAEHVARDHARRGISRALARAGETVVVVQAFGRDAVLEDGSVRWRFVAPGRAAAALRRAIATRAAAPMNWTPAAAVVRVALGEDPDVVHGFDLTAFPTTWLLGRACRRAGVPLAMHFHGGQPLAGSMRRLEAAALRDVARACFTDLDRARSFALRDEQLAQVLESSTELAPMSVEAARAQLGIAGDPLVVCPGRLAAVKDPLTTLRAFARVRARRPAARLYMLHREATLLEACRALVGDLGLGDAVRFVGERPHADMAAWYSAADFVMQASAREVCGMAIVEAVACGATPIVTDLPSFRFVAGELGGFAPVGNADALADALLAIDATPGRRAALLARFSDRLSFDALAATLGRLYREIAPSSIHRTSSA